MNPAQRVPADVELPRIITQNHGIAQNLSAHGNRTTFAHES
jgi:hypothetical protein